MGNKKDLRNDDHTRRELAKMKQVANRHAWLKLLDVLAWWRSGKLKKTEKRTVKPR